jgi:hypothetical protein
MNYNYYSCKDLQKISNATDDNFQNMGVLLNRVAERKKEFIDELVKRFSVYAPEDDLRRIISIIERNLPVLPYTEHLKAMHDELIRIYWRNLDD